MQGQLKCLSCGLMNFTTEQVCRRCKARLVTPQERFSAGIWYLNNQDYIRAIDAFEDSILANYYVDQAYFHLGNAYAFLGRFQEAEEARKRANLINPTLPAPVVVPHEKDNVPKVMRIYGKIISVISIIGMILLGILIPFIILLSIFVPSSRGRIDDVVLGSSILLFGCSFVLFMIYYRLGQGLTRGERKAVIGLTFVLIMGIFVQLIIATVAITENSQTAGNNFAVVLFQSAIAALIYSPPIVSGFRHWDQLQ